MAEEEGWDTDRDPDPTDPGRFTDPPHGIQLRWQPSDLFPETPDPRDLTPQYAHQDDDGLAVWWCEVSAAEMIALTMGMATLHVEYVPGRSVLQVARTSP